MEKLELTETMTITIPVWASNVFKLLETSINIENVQISEISSDATNDLYNEINLKITFPKQN